MNKKMQPLLLVAEDNEDDFFLIRRAVEKTGLLFELRWVRDGVELLDYLHGRGAYGEAGNAPCPSLIILDLNMPRKDGREALEEIKSDPRLKGIPVTVLTTSDAEKDMTTCYELSANSFIQKPAGFEAFSDMMKTLGKYWFEVVKLPAQKTTPCFKQ